MMNGQDDDQEDALVNQLVAQMQVEMIEGPVPQHPLFDVFKAEAAREPKVVQHAAG